MLGEPRDLPFSSRCRRVVRRGHVHALPAGLGRCLQLEYGIYLLLAIHAGVHYIAASLVSSAAGIAIGFGANKYWAFRRSGMLLRHLRG